MKICILHRPGGITGGDIPMAVEFGGALEEIGIETEVRPANLLHGLDAFDWVCIYAACSPDWGLPAAIAAKRAGCKLLTMPLWWPRDTRQAFYGAPGIDIAPGYLSSVKALLDIADLWACTTMRELIECWKLVPHHAAFVKGRGHNPEKQNAVDPQGYVLSIARVERHKNQAGLAYACRQLGVPLKCVGTIRDNEYAREVAQIGAELLGEVEHGDTMRILAGANVHALPSFGEIISGANCEAYEMGIPTVMSLEGAEPEYFKTIPHYCDPSNWLDIMEAVKAAWNDKRPRRERTLPTWRSVAIKTLEELQAWQGR